MSNKIKYLSHVFIALLFALLLHPSPLLAASSNTVILTVSGPSSLVLEQHKQTINDYIDRLKIMQNRTFELLQFVLDTPVKDINTFKANFNIVNNNVAILRSNILAYQTTLSADSAQFRDVLLILNALNYTKNALSELQILSQSATNVEKALLLEKFFESRIESIVALNLIQNIVSQY